MNKPVLTVEFGLFEHCDEDIVVPETSVSIMGKASQRDIAVMLANGTAGVLREAGVSAELYCKMVMELDRLHKYQRATKIDTSAAVEAMQ